jgi:acetolactate synthase I/II/III large subunit
MADDRPGHAALAHVLAGLGVDTIFGVTGEANVFLADTFVRAEAGRYVAAASEMGAVAMAKGYASVSGGLGVATVTHGPGLTNTLTALVDAVRERIPLVLVAGDTAVTDRDNIQNIDQRQVTLAAGAGFEQVRAPATLAHDTAAACRRARAEGRPVVLNVPADFMFQPCPIPSRLAFTPPQPAPGPAGAAVDEAVAAIASSRRPIVLAGRGAISSASRTELRTLAARAGAPVATTLKAKDLFRDDEFNLGLFGTLSHPVAAQAIADSDCIIAFGASLNDWTTARGAYLAGKRVVQCDLDPTRLAAHAPIDVGIAGDAATVAAALTTRLTETDLPPAPFRTSALRHQLATLTTRADAPNPAAPTPAGPLTLAGVLDTLDAAAPADRILVCDSGRFVFQAFSRVHVTDPLSFVPTVGFGAIGLGVGHAVGAACAADGRPVLLITGDGGFMLGGLAEFNTAVRYGLDIIVALCNDGSYGAEETFLRARDADPSIARFRWPDFAPVATSLGGQGVTVATPADLATLPTIITNRTTPLLIDFKLDPTTIEDFPH